MIGIASTSDHPFFSEECDAMRVKTSPLLEIVLVHLDHVASFIVLHAVVFAETFDYRLLH
jgi:hypothetical protein